MIIGGDFNSKCRKLLLKAGEMAGFEPGVPLRVDKLNADLKLDRNEMKSYLEYLSDRDLIHLKSIGGPLLYGHIELTKSGVKKAEDLRKKNN
ncbi:hypothetical protein DDZ15_04305 [Rhodohalobacter mucosus]|uniref:Uncharacterized protein n=2 Tax=Rhodohalobacter mucosus TaxID=2079485 RepID=A0A316TSU3_9BACT|nr:hypothetical protein DDZ15_04305 [Rhodohalobacter mucosus]